MHQDRRSASRRIEDKLLAEWFWTDRWSDSDAFGLPMEARGLYREMLTQAWKRGAQLPNDHARIRIFTGCDEKVWKRCWPLISKYWREEGDVLVNDVQREVYKTAVSAYEAAQARARAGASARWGGGK